MACLWIFSSLSMFFVNCGDKSWTLYSRPDKYSFIPVDAAQDPFTFIYLHLSSFTLILFHYCSSFTADTCSASRPPRAPFSKAAPHPHRAQTVKGSLCHPRGRNLHLSLLNFIQFSLFQPFQVSLSDLLLLMCPPPQHPAWCHQNS